MDEIFTRRSIRSFLDQPIEKTKINQLLKAAMQAPSAGNQQPWEFLVIQNKETLAQLSETSLYASALKEAPCGILLLADQNTMKYPEHWQQDLGAATQNLLLAAVQQGLGTVWLGVAPTEERMTFVRNTLCLPSHLLPYNIIGLGYPKNQKNQLIDRFAPDRIHFESYTPRPVPTD